MRVKYKMLASLLALIFLLTSSNSVYAAHRFGIDDQNTRQIKDSFADTGFPFKKAWETNLGGKVESQPIIAEGFIYVQAGKYLVKLTMDGQEVARSEVDRKSVV